MRGASYSGQTGVVTGATSEARLHQVDFGLKALGIVGFRLAAAMHAFNAAHLAQGATPMAPRQGATPGRHA
jgi:hypothetical protein